MVFRYNTKEKNDPMLYHRKKMQKYFDLRKS